MVNSAADGPSRQRVTAAHRAGSDSHRDTLDATERSPLLGNKFVASATIGKVSNSPPEPDRRAGLEREQDAAVSVTSYGSIAHTEHSSEHNLEAGLVEADVDEASHEWRHEEGGSRALRSWRVMQMRHVLGRTYRRHSQVHAWRHASVDDSDVGSTIESNFSAIEHDASEGQGIQPCTWHHLDAYGRFCARPEDVHHDLYEDLYSVDDMPDHAICGLWEMAKAVYYRARSVERGDALLLLAMATFSVIFLVLFGKTQYAAYQRNGCWWRCLLEAPEPTYLQRHDMAVYHNSE